jgi:hypothetical protein
LISHNCNSEVTNAGRVEEMSDEDVIAIIALMLGPAIVAGFGLWCALYGWAA